MPSPPKGPASPGPVAPGESGAATEVELPGGIVESATEPPCLSGEHAGEFAPPPRSGAIAPPAVPESSRDDGAPEAEPQEGAGRVSWSERSSTQSFLLHALWGHMPCETCEPCCFNHPDQVDVVTQLVDDNGANLPFFGDGDVFQAERTMSLQTPPLDDMEADGTMSRQSAPLEETEDVGVVVDERRVDCDGCCPTPRTTPAERGGVRDVVIPSSQTQLFTEVLVMQGDRVRSSSSRSQSPSARSRSSSASAVARVGRSSVTRQVMLLTPQRPTSRSRSGSPGPPGQDGIRNVPPRLPNASSSVSPAPSVSQQISAERLERKMLSSPKLAIQPFEPVGGFATPTRLAPSAERSRSGSPAPRATSRTSGSPSSRATSPKPAALSPFRPGFHGAGDTSAPAQPGQTERRSASRGSSGSSTTRRNDSPARSNRGSHDDSDAENSEHSPKSVPTSVAAITFLEAKVEGPQQESCEFMRHPPVFIVLQTALAFGLWLYYAIRSGEPLHLSSAARDPLGLVSLFPGWTELQVHKDCEDLRPQLWRWLSYQFSHSDLTHVGINSFMNLMFGIPLECFYGSCLMLIMYTVGVFGAACIKSVADIHVAVVGMSGGCYALVGMHASDLVLNWSHKRYRHVHVLVLVIFAMLDLMNSVVLMGGNGRQNNWSHLGGVVAGLSVGIVVGRSLVVKRWQRVMAAMILLTSGFIAAFCVAWAQQWPPRSFGESGWCWLRQVRSVTRFGDVAWHCVRCHSRECIQEWSKEVDIAVASERACAEQPADEAFWEA
eukprot:TRINITY_DN24640_c0_g1_i1.p1 TRINITY_DN24640_c0_g1~~TRINITY_DN24640_c0_g1_i1.p1  ORF type:complete len:777 (-),score=112.14 TRINITY_DN24640_c0_g1_i1:67-2397(-)